MSRYIDRQIDITEGIRDKKEVASNVKVYRQIDSYHRGGWGGGFKVLERLDELVQGYTHNLNDDLILIEFDDLKVKFCYGDQECKKQD